MSRGGLMPGTDQSTDTRVAQHDFLLDARLRSPPYRRWVMLRSSAEFSTRSVVEELQRYMADCVPAIPDCTFRPGTSMLTRTSDPSAARREETGRSSKWNRCKWRADCLRRRWSGESSPGGDSNPMPRRQAPCALRTCNDRGENAQSAASRSQAS